jgi:hypothetical protein
MVKGEESDIHAGGGTERVVPTLVTVDVGRRMNLSESSERFSQFISEERDRYTDRDNNRFVTSIGQVARYLEFLEVIERRYITANEAVVTTFQGRREWASIPGIRKLTPEEERDVREGWRRILELHLEIESFLVFAKTLLDKVAHFIEDYFGTARGLSLKSHDRWCRNAAAYAEAKGLDLPPEMIDTMVQLRTRISDTRDKTIAHLQNPRVVHATTVTAEGATAISHGFLNPKDSDTGREPTPVPDLVQLVDQYMTQLTSVVEGNRCRTRYQLDAQPGG